MSAAGLVAALDLAVWVYLLLGHGGFWRITRNETPAREPATWPEVCAVIPARNEADILESTLPTLLASDYPGLLRVLLVDDRSEDMTGAVAARIGEKQDASHRLTVLAGHARPGWKGKVAAMQCGLDRVTDSGAPRYVLFTDADIAYDKAALKRLVALAEAKQCVLASLMVKLRCKSPAECWLIPAFVYFFRMLYPFARVNDRDSRAAGAAGGCMLVRYDALMRAGGLAPIRAALIDDCAMGKMMKREGAVWLGLTQEVHSLRKYPRFGDIRAMVARTAYDQLRYSPLALAGTLMGMFLVYLAPILLTFYSSGFPRLLGAASWVLMSATFLPMVRFYGRPKLAAAALPAIAACYAGFTCDSAVQYWRGRGGLWKGRIQASGART